MDGIDHDVSSDEMDFGNIVYSSEDELFKIKTSSSESEPPLKANEDDNDSSSEHDPTTSDYTLNGSEQSCTSDRSDADFHEKEKKNIHNHQMHLKIDINQNHLSRPLPTKELKEKPLIPASTAKNALRFKSAGIYSIQILIYSLVTVLVLMGSFKWLPNVDLLFSVYITVMMGVFSFVSVLGGLMIETFGIDVMYTRKTIHFASFFLPFVLFYIIPFEKNLTTYILTFQFSFVAYIPLIEEIRTYPGCYLLELAYKSFDRKEDRPFTLTWAVTQSLSTFFVLTPLGIILGKVFAAPSFIFIPVFTVAVGDGLAEIVGRNFGKHKTQTTALFTNAEFTRSCEGSMCVFISTFVSIIVVTTLISPGTWNFFQIMTNLLILPILMTYVEAVSPHTWDNAILLFVGGGFILLTFIVPILFTLLQDLLLSYPHGDTNNNNNINDIIGDIWSSGEGIF